MAEHTIFPDATTPATAEGSDSDAVTLGTVFYSAVGGNVVGIRFWKDSTNSGTSQTAALYAMDTTLLGTIASFAGQTSHGWQRANFASPIAIEANTHYIAAVFWPAGKYPFTGAFFNAGDYQDAAPLTAPQTPSGGANNGRYEYGPSITIPNQSFNRSCYFSDVIFDDGSSAVAVFANHYRQQGIQ
jgi:hypothetical protein